MKVKLEKIKPKCSVRHAPFSLPVYQVDTMRQLDIWLENRNDFKGKLPWSEHLSAKIIAEINARSNAKDRNHIEKKIVLNADLVERMAMSDDEYISKGYLPDWNNRVSHFLDLLIRTYTRQLNSIFGDEMPSEIDGYLNKSRKTRRTLNSNSGSEGSTENG